MRPTPTIGICALLLVAAVLAGSLVAAPTEGAAAAPRKAAAPTAKRIKALRRLTRRLSRQIAGLESQTSALEVSRSPSSLPPSGPAGGALSDTYPAPLFPPGSIGTAELGEGAVGSAEIADGAILGVDLAPRSIGSSELAKGSFTRADFGSVIGAFTMAQERVVAAPNGPRVPLDNVTDKAEVSCGSGTRMLSGGWRWNVGGDTTSIMVNSPAFPENGGNPNVTWVVFGRAEGGAPEIIHELLPSVLCLH